MFTLPRRTSSTLVLLAALAGSSTAHAQFITGGATFSGTVTLTEDLILHDGDYLALPGTEFVFPNSSVNIIISTSAFVDFIGTPSDPVIFRGQITSSSVGSFSENIGRIIANQFSRDLTFEHCLFRDASGNVLTLDADRVTIRDTTLVRQESDFLYREEGQFGDRAIIDILNSSDVEIDRLSIEGFNSQDGRDGSRSSQRGAPGFPGSRGYNITAIDLADIGNVTITNSRITDLRAGNGGIGGDGTIGNHGADGDNGGIIDDNAHDGEPGDPGGNGATGGIGGDAIAINLDACTNVLIAQNIIANLIAGAGGNGGDGGRGGNGGDGGDGVDGVLFDGGNAGDGGDGGNGGRAGSGQRAGSAIPIYIAGATDQHRLINNTFANITSPPRAQPGTPGNGGSRGLRGSPGAAGSFGSTGASGSNGSNGSTGGNGSQGQPAVATAFQIFGASTVGPLADITNNVATYTGNGTATFVAAGLRQVTTDRNAASPGVTFATGAATTGALNPGTVALDTNLAPAANATALIDAGRNDAFPFFSAYGDFNNNPRFTDVFAIPDTGTPDFNPLIIDLGAIEAAGRNTPCPVDLNGDGLLDNGDIQAFVQLFIASDLAADTNADGILDNGDIITFVEIFLAGC